jgi:3-oxoacyl-[acyl-carrier-protein] synthase-3
MAGLNWSQPESAALIGDGAAAVVLRFDASIDHPWIFGHETLGQFLEHCRIDGGGHFLPPYDFVPENRAPYCFDMNGPAVFRTALKYLPELVSKVQAAWGDFSRIQVLPHQASPKALELIRQKLGFSTDQFHCVVRRVGNMIAAGMPFVLDHCRRTGAVRAGDSLMLLGTSAGYSQAAAIWQL